uniref:NADH-ubiquinone oxidoreductase chain 5 n=1 Tax=Psococerastis albimaculata TaxID=1264641 RepID=M9P7U1_9NEOP|nr:NADH dehydrogenase subunit 5 [Psococerastis albimaculata]AFY16890.1 NADH dehydrogenase subunit 5 [Psococerastis albimaculata]
MYMKYNMNFVIMSILFSMSLFFFIVFIYLIFNNKSYLFDFEVFSISGVGVSMCVYMDWMSSSFMSFVLLISFVVVCYSISYMGSDKYSSMFIMLVFFFVLSMMLLIISPNLISILLGWDGLGLISYCLVIYYQNIKSYNAGMVTAMTNRIGDVMLLMGIAWMINFGSWNYLFYFNYSDNMFYIIGVFMVLAAMTKSAQIPFSSWLPAAMAAPTPVSALVHSSTLVTAGVYLLIRFDYIFKYSFIYNFMIVVSVLTMFMSGLGAIFEYDLKKIIALSTLSQLGLMISTLCLGMTEFCFFHLLTHALFKSLLFMCAGYIIHGMKDSQDIRFMGSLTSQSPLLSIYFNMSNLSLCGMPFLAGFYSKDLILENILMFNMNSLIYFLYFLSTMLTVVYTFRLIYFSMVNSFKLMPYHCFNDEDYLMLFSMIVMVFMVIIGGSMMMWLMFMDFSGIILGLYSKLLTLVVCLTGGLVGFFLGKYSLMSVNMSSFIYMKSILGEMWFLPYISTYLLNMFPLNIGYFYLKIIDLGWGELVGGQGIYKILVNLSKNSFKIEEFNFYISMFMFILLWVFILMMF